MAALAAGLLLGSQALATGPSVLSRGPDGWLATEAYLTATGKRVERLDRSLTEAEPDADVLVLGFPFRRPLTAAESRAVAGYAAGGGSVLVAYSQGLAPSGSERTLFATFGIEHVPTLPDLPLTPWGWRGAVNRDWRPRPSGTLAKAEAPTMRIQRWWPGGGGVRLLEGESGESVAALIPHRAGRLILVPATLFANSSIDIPGNADLLASLAAWLGERWLFDEYHHGLVSREAAGTTDAGASFDLFALHLGALYLLAMLALARRFGPARSAPVVRTASTASFLVGLGSLHHRLGHHARAAELLPQRAAELDPRLPPRTEEISGRAVDGAELTRIARQIAGRQRSGHGRS
jgi:hypothetical protein